MTVTCVVCGGEFQAVRHQAKYCGGKCSKRAQRGAGPTRMPTPAPNVEVDNPNVGLVSTVINELTAIDRLNTSIGQAALRLATRMETSTVDTGSGLAAMTRELRAVMGQLMASGQAAMDPLDELKARRDHKRAG